MTATSKDVRQDRGVKFILSRKGFDSSFGGHASPIMPDGTMLSLPIPVTPGTYGGADKIRYSDLQAGTHGTYLDVMRELQMKALKVSGKPTPIDASSPCHLDPDLDRRVVGGRDENWRGAFGQGEAAEGHLVNQDVRRGDVFLFFGWFRRVDAETKKFSAEDPDGRHILFGYLQVDEVCRDGVKPDSWRYEHPHFERGYTHREDGTPRINAVYIASRKLELPGVTEDLPGFGTFAYRDDRVLTKEGKTRTRWALPGFFSKLDISYHRDGGKYGWKGDHFQSAYKGQEFVFDGTPEAIDWFKEKL